MSSEEFSSLACTEFAAPWGLLLKTTSTLLTIVLLGVSAVGGSLMPAAAPSFTRWLVILVGPLVLLASVPFVVRGYRLEFGTLFIRRLGWETRIPLMGLQGVHADPEAMRHSIRLLGNGGGFVFAGLFRTRTLGLFRAFVNDPNRSVVLRFPGRTIVVSPHDPAAFVEAIKAQQLFPTDLPELTH